MKFVKRVVIGIGTLVVVLAAAIGIFWERLPIRLIWPYLVQSPIATGGEVQRVTFVGTHAGEQTYFIYLPQDYQAEERRYRTLYHLHGAYLRESWAGYECNYIGSKMEDAVSAGIIEPMLVVCLVDPDGDRMWSDSFDNRFLASTGFLQDLIPHVDTTYRTVADRSGRGLQGFSMGGFGAVTNGFRAPELFSSIIVWDGALHNWETLSTTRKGIASKMFGTEAFFNQWSPWELSANATVDLDIFMVVGEMPATRDFGDRFRPHLEQTGREFTYFDSACPHSIFCMMDALSSESFSFLANSFARQEGRATAQLALNRPN